MVLQIAPLIQPFFINFRIAVSALVKEDKTPIGCAV
jgi:hypothetical protein